MSKKRQNGKAKKKFDEVKKKYERNNSRLRRWGRLLIMMIYKNLTPLAAFYFFLQRGQNICFAQNLTSSKAQPLKTEVTKLKTYPEENEKRLIDVFAKKQTLRYLVSDGRQHQKREIIFKVTRENLAKK